MTNCQANRDQIERNFHALARSIAQVFNGTATVSEGNNFYARIQPGISPAFCLCLNSHSGMIEVGGVYDKDAKGVLVCPRDAGFSGHSINVSASKGVRAICFDIKRRFVQEYARQCDALDAIRAQRNNHHNCTASGVALVYAALGNTGPNQSHNPNRVYPQYGGLDCVSSLTCNGLKVSFDRLELTYDKALRVIELLRAMQAE